MLKEQLVTISLVSGSNSEYIIRDNCGITLGRVFIIEISSKNKCCILRIKFYKWGESSYRLLKNSLSIFIEILFKNANLNKINILADEDINIAAFTDLGFELEGIIANSIKSDFGYKNEILFGLELDKFKNISINRGLHIKGSKINLSVLTPENAESVLNYYIKNKDYLSKFEPDREKNFYTLDIQKRILIESYREFLSGKSVNLGIYKDKRFIGKIQISNIVMGVFKSAFVGYSIDEDEQGKGYMKEALKLTLEYAFNEMDLHRIEASTLIDNVRSQKVLLSCGFKEIGLNEKYIFINGKWQDHLTFNKINPIG
ncbi:GNAT family N-acetyltransferase [Clostridium coskatii]|uniref:Ribosomal N-acetyltransferase YdaF n=1 Tax=Clostridium coskatii TaxID=1705578 RepID=A0A162J7D5_9CLOT|nr:GNAT family protein [Clostridium coskatii]OAA91385.1 putative ribosomal N-acetyltransferase YdaF [Clostridium coskatii]OBR94017.1 putative ribosomal N-acetyltransferase YdaF [Clostridium coskatii]